MSLPQQCLYNYLQLPFQLPVAVDIAVFHDPYFVTLGFQMEACPGKDAGREHHPRDVSIIDIAVDEPDIVRRFHGVNRLADTNDDVRAGELGNEFALLVDRDAGNVLDRRFLALLLGFGEDIVVL